MSLTLVVLAAGLGSRFGGVKQMAPVDEAGQTLVEYSMFDAARAGFDRVVCVVTPSLERQFDARIGQRVRRHMDVAYAHQTLDALPAGYAVPSGRVKPWGTAQAVLCALPQVDGSFATINADDFYGADAYQRMAAHLLSSSGDHALAGYRLDHTLSPNGAVSRGVCEVSAGRLIGIAERTALRAAPDGAVDEAGVFYPGDTTVSMNLWGFRPAAAEAFERLFPAFLGRPDAATAEFYLPDVGASLVPHVRVLPTSAVWKGVTYAEDMPELRAHLAGLVEAGMYPRTLWPS